MNLCYIIILIILIIYILFVFRPEIFPSWIWKSKTLRRFSRWSNNLVESYTNIRVKDIQLQSFYDSIANKYGKKGRIMVLHSVKWCPACKRFKPIWFKLKQTYNSSIPMIEIDEDENTTPGINSFPTIIFRNADGSLEEYNQDLTEQSFEDYLKNKANL